LLIGLGLARLKFDSRPSSESTPLPLVTVLAVRASDLDDAVTFTGAIAAREEAALSAEGEGGRVAGMFAEVGDRVRAGAVLARIDTSFVAPQVASLEASLEESRANAAVAEADYRRAQAVAVSGALSVQEIERRGAASVATAAKVKVVGAQLSEARERLRRTEIRASEEDLDVLDLITPEDVVVTLSHTGYIKRQPVSAYRAQKRGGKGRSATAVKASSCRASNMAHPLV
jgi:multidrug efflux pump subunit AcrA (membrane-fusion protein)